MLLTSLQLMKSPSKTEAPIFYLYCVLCFQRQSFRLYFVPPNPWEGLTYQNMSQCMQHIPEYVHSTLQSMYTAKADTINWIID